MKQDVMKQKRSRAARRAHRVRTRMHGTSVCPRMSVFRSLRHIRVQLIDDVASRTVLSASDIQVDRAGKKPIEIARAVGALLGKHAAEKGIASAVFDRGSYRYHGRVAALADGAREAGLNF